jgi:cell division protein FtsI/penicillin-binding protein 2
VGGRTYENYDDYPSAYLGRIDLRTAFAQSCNTAFIGQRGKLGASDLAAAAGSLGVGTDYDVGFPAYFGSVPTGGNDNARAEAVFGQGKDQVSPLSMALVAASVEAGRTVLPTLLAGQRPTSTAAPLTREEAAELKQLMRGVVTQGSGRRLLGLDGPDVIAKTGTAEYGGRTPPKTHAWMIAGQGDLAVAVYVQDGESGSGSAGPLLESFLRGAR